MSVMMSCANVGIFYSLHTKVTRFWWNLQEIITSTNRWTDCILGAIGTWTREQDTTENLNQHQKRCCYVPTDFRSFTVHTEGDAFTNIFQINSQISVTNFKAILLSFVRVIQYLSTEILTYINSLTYHILSSICSLRLSAKWCGWHGNAGMDCQTHETDTN